MLINTPTQAATPKSSTSTGYLLFVFEILVVLAAAYFFTWPQYQALQAGKLQLAADQETLQQVQEQAAAYQSSVKVLSATDLSSVNKAVPPKDNVTDLYAYIETLVNASSLTMTSMQITDGSTPSAATTSSVPAITATGEPAPTSSSDTSTSPTVATPVLPAGIASANIYLVVTGSNAQLEQLLGSFQNSLRLIDVQGVSVVVDDTGLETFTVDAIAYYQQ